MSYAERKMPRRSLPCPLPPLKMRDSIYSAPYARLRDELRIEPRTWLVTGVAGFIGSNLLEQLLTLGQNVVGFDNFATGYHSNINDALLGNHRGEFRLVEGDVRDLAACRAACDGADYVLHHAALASVPRSVDDPTESSSVNVGGFLNVLIAARDAGVRRVVYASSSAVYGDLAAAPQVESRVGNPVSPYAADKKANELYGDVFGRTYGLEIVGLRYFNIFGRRQDPAGAYAAVIPRWVSSLLSGEVCHIYGDGETTRDFCHVQDAVQANVLAALAPASATGEVYNVGCGCETSLNELFRMIRLGLAGYENDVAAQTPVYESFRAGDIRRSVADISKARQYLGFEPTFSVAEGLGEALEWYAARAQESKSLIA